MSSLAYAGLVCRALLDLVLFDLRKSPFLPLTRSTPHRATPDVEHRICDAVLLATCLYWKPVLCLQRSVCLARMLRVRGVPARLVVGYRPLPFFSHAWVEVDSRVVNDSPVYRERLRILYTA